jgi:hypothetical protein
LKPIRELMQDKRVAAGLAGLALLFVAYRFSTTGKRPAVPAVADNGATAAAASPAPGDNAASPNGAYAPPTADNTAASVPRGDVAWNWERNPFIGPPKKGSGAGPEAFPTIVIPGFGKNAHPISPPPAADPAIATRTEPGIGNAEGTMPELRGTVLSGDRKMAVFGTHLVPAGEQVDGWTVDRVTAYDVSIRKGGERRTLAVFKPASAREEGGKP